jgi:hypothetical protein
MKPFLSAFLLLFVFCAQSGLAQNSSAVRERLSLDRGWLFHEGDIPSRIYAGEGALQRSGKQSRLEHAL